MLIAVAANGREANAVIPETFEESTDLLIVETDRPAVVAFYKSRDKENLFFAKQTALHDCEAIVCGKMQKPGFEAIAEKSITRYYGTGLMPVEAAQAAEANMLPFITDHEGGHGCGSHEINQCEEDMKKLEGRE